MDDLVEGAAGALTEPLEVSVGAFVAVRGQFVDAVAAIVEGFVDWRREKR
jgi:hypothetical protein